MTTSLLYVSKTLIDPAVADAVVADILVKARARNDSLGVSGALIYTGTRFAQILEGERAVVDRQFETIRADPRHTDVVVLDEWPIDQRLFSNWSMAYAGPSAYVGRAVSKPLAEALRGSKPDIQALIRLMVQFVASPQMA